MEAILHCVAQPVWVVDAEGAISFVNPAGVAALGYDSLSELQGKPGHDTIHHKHPDGTPYPASECPISPWRRTGSCAATGRCSPSPTSSTARRARARG